MPPKKLLALPPKKISLSKLKHDGGLLKGLDIPSPPTSDDSSSSKKQQLDAEWQSYCVANGVDPTSKSRFKRWKTENQESALAEGGTEEWGLTALKASKVGAKTEKDAKSFKKQLLSYGSLGVLGTGPEKLGQGFEQTAVHFCVTSVPGALIAQQIVHDSGKTDFITVETWKTAREQMNPTAVVAQGKGTIGDYLLISSDEKVKRDYKSYIERNPSHFGCCVAPTLNAKQKRGFTQISAATAAKPAAILYQHNTGNQKYLSEEGTLEFGEGTNFGVPNSEDAYDIIKEVTCMTCWLCNMPLVKQGPMNNGKPSKKLEPPHTEHVLNILDALFYLDLFESADAKLMIDYHCFLEEWYYGERSKPAHWAQAPTKENFFEYLTSIYGSRSEEEMFSLYKSDVTNLNAAWLKIFNFKLEYLYAHPDCNYEKNDDSLLSIGARGSELVFNEPMARNLADRIWRKRLILTGGLLDVLGLSTFKTAEARKQWTENVICSWRRQLSPTAEFINSRRGVAKGEDEFYGFMTLGAYITRLPKTIKEVMTNHASVSTDAEMSLSRKEIKFVPTDQMILTLLHIISFQIGAVAKSKSDVADFIAFCQLPQDKGTSILANYNSKLTASRARASVQLNEKTKQRFLQIVAFNALFNPSSPIISYMRTTFTRLFYGLAEKSETNRNVLISMVVAKCSILLLDEFHRINGSATGNEPLKAEIGQYLETEKACKFVKLLELFSKSDIRITMEALEPAAQPFSEHDSEYAEDLSSFEEYFADKPLQSISAFDPVNGVIEFDFDESTIPPEIKEETEPLIQQMSQARGAASGETAQLQEILLEISKATEILDDGAIFDGDDELGDVLEPEPYSAVLEKIRALKRRPHVKPDPFLPEGAPRGGPSIMAPMRHLPDEYIVKKDGITSLLKAADASILIDSAQLQGKSVVFRPPQYKAGSRRRPITRNKKTRKYKKKRVSRKYIR
jgi:hypothetical protein